MLWVIYTSLHHIILCWRNLTRGTIPFSPPIRCIYHLWIWLNPGLPQTMSTLWWGDLRILSLLWFSSRWYYSLWVWGYIRGWGSRGALGLTTGWYCCVWFVLPILAVVFSWGFSCLQPASWLLVSSRNYIMDGIGTSGMSQLMNYPRVWSLLLHQRYSLLYRRILPSYPCSFWHIGFSSLGRVYCRRLLKQHLVWFFSQGLVSAFWYSSSAGMSSKHMHRQIFNFIGNHLDIGHCHSHHSPNV